jgi:hypothetical protein
MIAIQVKKTFLTRAMAEQAPAARRNTGRRWPNAASPRSLSSRAEAVQ